MNLFPLSNEEKGRLQKFGSDQNTIFALKKLFLNICVSSPPSNEAIEKVAKAFHELSVISPNDQKGKTEENLV